MTTSVIGLTVASWLSAVAPVMGQAPGIAEVLVVSSPGTHVATDWGGINRPFEPAGLCLTRSGGATAREVLGPQLKAVLVHSYDKKLYRSFKTLTAYVRRVLVAHPEGGQPRDFVQWSEGYPGVEMSGSIEYLGGQRSRIELSSGYLHFEDSNGCQWWGRYLGGDRKRWIVRE